MAHRPLTCVQDELERVTEVPAARRCDCQEILRLMWPHGTDRLVHPRWRMHQATVPSRALLRSSRLVTVRSCWISWRDCRPLVAALPRRYATSPLRQRAAGKLSCMINVRVPAGFRSSEPPSPHCFAACATRKRMTDCSYDINACWSRPHPNGWSRNSWVVRNHR